MAVMQVTGVRYVEPLCGHAMRYLLSLFCESAYEGILIADIEVKVRSDECLAKCTAVVWGEDTYF